MKQALQILFLVNTILLLLLVCYLLASFMVSSIDFRQWSSDDRFAFLIFGSTISIIGGVGVYKLVYDLIEK